MNTFKERTLKIPSNTKRNIDLNFKLIDLVYRIMELKGITYSDLAREMNIPLSEIENMMRGTYDFTFSDVSKLETILNVKLIEIKYEQEY